MSACGYEPLAKTPANTNGFQASLIGTIEGCRVYAFGTNAYTVLCGSSEHPEPVPARSSYTQSCGKNCLRRIDVDVSAPAREVRP